MIRLGVFLIMIMTDRGQAEENQRQHHEDQGLHEADENLQSEERNRQQERNQEGHGRQHDFACEDIAEETKAKRNDAGELGDQLQKANEGADSLHNSFAVGVEEFFEVFPAQGFYAEYLNQHNGGDGQRKGHVQIGAGGADEGNEFVFAFFRGRGGGLGLHQNQVATGHGELSIQIRGMLLASLGGLLGGLFDMGALGWMVEADAPHARQDVSPVADNDEEEDGRNPGEVAFGVLARHAFAQAHQSFDSEFHYILQPVGHDLHASRSQEGDNE